MANRDGNWSEARRFHPLHHAQLTALVGVVRGAPGPIVVCGDFNIDRDSSLFAGFVQDTGLSGVFKGDCLPAFHAEYLPAGAIPRCIDFILASEAIEAEGTTLLFTEKVALPGGPGYASDHLGLSARLLLPAS